MALLLGWMGVMSLDVFVGLPWLANLLFFVSMMFYMLNKKTKIILTLLAIVFGLFTLGIKKIPADEGGAYYTVSVGLGFVFWMSSFIILLISHIREKSALPNNQNVGHP